MPRSRDGKACTPSRASPSCIGSRATRAIARPSSILWWSIVKLDRHNNGGFSSGEQAQGNPYHPGAIETCCTVAWIAMSVDMLRMTGNSVVADELELSTLNQVLGYQHPSGKWCTYNTPMDGVRRKSVEEIAFQIRPGSEEINCCSANAPRGFGMIAQWALMSDGRGLVVNWYGPSTMTARLQGRGSGLEATDGLSARRPDPAQGLAASATCGSRSSCASQAGRPRPAYRSTASRSPTCGPAPI